MDHTRAQAQAVYQASDEFFAAALDQCDQFKFDSKFHVDFMLAQFCGNEL